MTKGRLALAILALLVVAALARPGPARLRVANPPVTYSGRVGVQVSHLMFDLPSSQILAELGQLHAGGVSWVREDFSWPVAEPRRGVFDWRPFDHFMKAASRDSVHVLGILDYSAPWASSDPSGRQNIHFPPKDDEDFGAYAVALVSRYGMNGSFWLENPKLSPEPLTAVEIWNEPYGSWAWLPDPDPAAYAALVRRTAPAIHAVDRHMAILMSGDLKSWDDRTVPHEQPWLARLLSADPVAAKLVDAIDVHPYPSPWNLGPYTDGDDVASSFGRVPTIRQTELAVGVKLPIWITEIGWSTAPGTPWTISDQTQAAYVVGAIRRALVRWRSYVSKVFVFGWYRSSGHRADVEDNFGLLSNSGVLKPAWIAITKLLGGKPGLPDPQAPMAN